MRQSIDEGLSSDSPRTASPVAVVPSRSESLDQAVSPASQRLRSLAALSGSLTDPLGPEDAANLVEQHALSALGATSAVVVTLGVFPRLGPSTDRAPDDGAHPTLHVVHAIGLRAEVNAALDDLPLDAPVPFAEVARLGEPLFLSSETELRRYPDWGTAMIDSGTRAAAIVPVWANGELRGVLGLSWPEPRPFDEDERAFVLTLGVMCAQAIMRAHLRAAELQARAGERRAREAAEQANQFKARLVATISHELRTPINAVIGYVDLLSEELDGPITTQQRNHLTRMRASGKHLFGLVEDLLSYARIEAGQETVRPDSFLLSDVVEETLILIRPLAERKGLALRVSGVDDAPVPLHTDRQKLCQVLTNVLANAVKFTRKGHIAMRVSAEGSATDLRVVFEVEDSGDGIAIENRELVFDAFWRLSLSNGNPAGSSGLGLAVARQLARLLGGDVILRSSDVGVGTMFVVSVPASHAN
jgi:signal transduction histidine kinase